MANWTDEQLAQIDAAMELEITSRLGWRPRSAETTIAETAESLRDLGLLENR